MKQKGIRQLLMILLICGISQLTAQKKTFNAGYIIEKSGDTIYGLVKDRTPEPFVSLYNKIRFREPGRSRSRKYGPDDILGYGYLGQHFVSMPFREESSFFKFRYYTDAGIPRQFLRVIHRSPELIYLEQQFICDESFYLDAIPFFYKPGTTELVRVTQGILGFKKKQLAEYFYECPEFIRELSRRNLRNTSVWDLYELYLAHSVN